MRCVHRIAERSACRFLEIRPERRERKHIKWLTYAVQ